MISLGIAAIIAPVVSTLMAETWIALILTFAGAAELVYTFQTRRQNGFIWKLLLSGLYIATGIMLLVNPLTGVITLTLIQQRLLAFPACCSPRSSFIDKSSKAIVS